MFHLHDQTRRRIGLAAFALLCVAPTAIVIGWAAAWHLPGHARAETDRLGRELGLDVALDGLRHPRPGVVVYEGLTLLDPETGQTVLKCPAVEATWTQTTLSDGQTRPAITLVASQPEIETVAADRLWRIVERALLGQNGRPQVEFRLVASTLTLHTPKNAQTLRDVEAGIGAHADGAQAEAAFRLAGSEAAGPVWIRATRNRQLTPPASGFDLNTGEVEVPCQILSIGLPEFHGLGPASRFRGAIWAHETPSGWQGEIQARLLGLDLDSLVSERFPHKLSGTAEVVVERARFCHGRLEEAAGTFSAGPGTIGRSLLETAAERLGLALGVGTTDAKDMLPYRQLALDFSIDASGLRLNGRCTAPASGAVLADHRGALLARSAAQSRPVVALIQTLVPANEIQVPATRQTDWLQRHLPLPDIRAPLNARTPAPHGQLRLGRTPGS